MKKYYIIGDVHGRLDMLVSALKDWDKDNEQLILLGDYVDYGKYGKQTLSDIKHLQDNYNAILLRGNHDEIFKRFLKEPKFHLGEHGEWQEFGRRETFMSFLEENPEDIDKLSPKGVADKIKNKNPHLVDFIDNMKPYFETEKYIFVHAGIDTMLDDWKQTEEFDFLTIRGEFLKGINRTGKTIVFGHSRTGVIRGMQEGKDPNSLYKADDLDDSVWVSPCGTKIGIDGGNVFGGFLHGLHINEDKDEISITTVDQNTTRTHTKLTINGGYAQKKD